MLRRCLTVLSVLTISLGALLGCARRTPAQLTIGVRTATDHCPFYIADKLGYYADAGLHASVQLMPSNTEIIEALQRGDLQMGAVPITTAITAIAGGARLRIVAMTGRGGDGLLVRSNGGVAALPDLRGKRIATIRGSILDVLLRQALEDAGLDADRDVELVYFNALGDMIQALKTEQVEATSNTEPFLTDAELQGWGVIQQYYTVNWPDHPCCVVVARQDQIDRHAEVVRAAVGVHARAVKYAVEHPRPTAEIIVAYLDAFDADLVEASLSPTRMRVDYAISAQETEIMSALLYRYGLIGQQVGADELLDLSFLKGLS